LTGAQFGDDGSVTSSSTGYRLYSDLAPWWPLISPPDEYEEEAAFAAGLLGSGEPPARDVLELGSGGGHNASYLKDRFTMTLVDRSAKMLEVSRKLNPQCEHIRGDMRTLRLGRTFDAVFVHDAIDYMLTTTDLVQAVETAFAHCRPGAVAVFVPDSTAETFQPTSGVGGSDDGTNQRAARYLEWTWDPDPADTWVDTVYVFVLRDEDGSVEVVHERHRTGLFARTEWLRILESAGFEATVVTENTTEDRMPRDVFVGRRPAAT
jgi:SAM-dependent methyltransferase